jgi:hypothetical protein
MGIWQLYLKWAPQLSWGVKALGLKIKPINGSKPPRETRVRDEATQRFANILAYLVPHRGDPTSSSFVSESRPGRFLHVPLWAGI